MHTITITVPTPRSNENRRKGNAMRTSFARKKDVRAAIQASRLILEKLDPEELDLPWTTCNVHVRWYHKTRNYRDMWNMVGSLKGTLDGIVRAGILADDDQVQPPSIERFVDSEHPRVELILTHNSQPKRFKGVV